MVPEFLPINENNWGNFSWNYINALKDKVDLTVFHSRLNNDFVGLQHKKINDVDIYRYALFNKKPKGVAKLFGYAKWFIQSKSLIDSLIKNIDIIHVHGALLNGSLAVYCKKKYNIPFVITEHTGPFQNVVNTPYKKQKVKQIMELADAVLTVSEHVKSEIFSQHIHPKRVDVTYNPLNAQIFKLKPQTRKNQMVFAGRFDENKGLMRTATAFKEFLNHHPDWNLIVCGDGREKKELLNFIEKNQLENKIIYKGMLDEKALAEVFNESKIFVSPTEFESFGMAIAEALACGCVVITTNQTAPKEYVKDFAGILINPKEVKELTQAMQNIASNYSKYSPQQISDSVTQRFSFEIFADKLINIYSSLIKS